MPTNNMIKLKWPKNNEITKKKNLNPCENYLFRLKLKEKDERKYYIFISKVS